MFHHFRKEIGSGISKLFSNHKRLVGDLGAHFDWILFVLVTEFAFGGGTESI